MTTWPFPVDRARRPRTKTTNDNLGKRTISTQPAKKAAPRPPRSCANDASENRYQRQDSPDQDRPDVGAIMTAATLRQIAAPQVTVKSKIHMADDPRYCLARAPTPRT